MSNIEGIDSKELVLVVGSVKPFDLLAIDERDQDEDLSAATRATFHVKEASSDSTSVLTLTTEAAGLTLNASSIEGVLTQLQADALVPGEYIGGVAIEFPSGWYHSDPFTVHFIRSVAGVLA